ncbi:MAG: hypothetical protein BZ137_03335 [Methanosphaera sp. rholeuAM130]|nr:MAG: hypothetical protein BZ137_03335 [Methanosphaera sp. rholeuAM130]
MNLELITNLINIVSVSAIVSLMIYYSIMYKRTSVEVKRLRTTRQNNLQPIKVKQKKTKTISFN